MSKSADKTIEAEIFSVGVWNGEAFTRETLVEIAANFERFRGQIKPPLKFGHDDRQTLLGQKDGDPALGWVERLRVEGDRLLATFAQVPPVVFQAVRSGRYRRVSAEIYTHVRQGGQNLGKALKAVALLGADLPAVNNLKDLTAYMTAAPQNGLSLGDFTVFGLAVRRGRINPLSNKEDSMDATLPSSPVELELEDLRAYKARNEARELSRREDSRQEMEMRLRENFRVAADQARVFAEDSVRRGKLAPSLRDSLLGELTRWEEGAAPPGEAAVENSPAARFTGGAPLSVSWDWVRRLIDHVPVGLPRGEAAVSGFSQNSLGNEALSGEEENPSIRLSRLAAAKMVELNLTYGQAADYVLKTSPALAGAYRDFTLNAHLGG